MNGSNNNNLTNCNAEIDFNSLTPVQRYYNGKCIFITGATGLVGKILLEKLLRSCPGIRMIYVMVRPRKSMSAEQRMDKIFNSELFGPAKKILPDLKKKITLIYGDLEKLNLGISDEDYQLLEANVQIIFHSAACVNFLAPLKKLMRFNVTATEELLELSKRCNKFEAFVHMSTLFVDRTEDFTVPEVIPKPNMPLSHVMDMMKYLETETVDKITRDIIGDTALPYVYSKRMAEIFLQEKCDNQKLAIVRPSIISSTNDDPIPGFNDVVQSFSGIFLAIGKGFLRCVYIIPNVQLTCIPADRLISATVAAAWHLSTRRTNHPLVLNCGKTIPPLKDIYDAYINMRFDHCLVNIYRFPDFKLCESHLSYVLNSLIQHYIPAIIGDTLLFIFTGKTLMFRLYNRINKLMDIYRENGTHPWNAEMNNYHALKNSLSEEDKKVFNMDLENIDFMEYFRKSVAGGRKYLGHEDPSNIPYARKKAKIWFVVTTLLKWCIIFYVLNYFFGSYIF